MNINRRQLRAVAASLLAAGVTLAACGDDDDTPAAGTAEPATGAPATSAAAASTTATDTVASGEIEAAPTTATEDVGADFDLAAYCAATLATEVDPGPDIEFETARPAEITAAAKEYASGLLRALADDLVAAAPAELGDEAARFSQLVDEVAATGDFALFETPEFAELQATAHAYDLANCGWNGIEVALSEYAFGGLPTELPSGPTSFELTNNGEEPHEMVVFRKRDGVTTPIEKLLELPEEQAMQQIEYTAAGFAAAGDAGYAVADLQPGEYVALCFVPVGGGEDGPPHVAEGMTATFTVEG